MGIIFSLCSIFIIIVTMKLIVGLGNPGQEYENTRHSIGFFLVEKIMEGGKWKVESGKRNGEWQESSIDDQKVIALKPMEFMNRSGGAVSAVANFYKIEPKDILVIHDDIDLPVGKIQLKLGGSSAGHNGLKSIIEKLGIKDFWRLRIGVDRPVNQDDVADYVLSAFKKEEKNLIEKKMSEIEILVHRFLEVS